MSAPFVVAQLIVPADGLIAGGTGGVQLVPDWSRGWLYLVNDNFIRTYTTEKATQTPVRSVALSGITIYCTVGVDALTGDILMLGAFPGHSIGNAMILFRVAPATGAVGNWHGTGSFSSGYPVGYYVPESVVGVVCAGVSYGVVKEDAFSGAVAIGRMSSPSNHAGYENTIVSNNQNNRANQCAGASGAGGASTFLIDTNNPGQTTVNVYYVRISPGAETYDPATWPTMNSHITSGILATVPMGSINPAWTQIAGDSVGYDQTDGNVIGCFNNVVSNPQSFAKINATTGAIMWVAQVNVHGRNLQRSRLAGGRLWLPGGNLNGSTVIDTATGAATVTPLTGLTFTESSVVCDGASLVAFAGSYAASGTPAGTNPADPAPGTSSFSGGYGLLWSTDTPPPVSPSMPLGQLSLDDVQVTIASIDTACKIYLDWSDDRGHSFGNPVAQTLGGAGEYRTSLQWQRLGYARDRVFRLTWSCALPTALQGCWVDVTPAQS